MVQGVRRSLSSAGKEGSRSSHHGVPPQSKRPIRPLGRSPYSHSFFLFVLGKPRFGQPWISLLLLRTPTAAPSRARFCPCGNLQGPPFVSIKSRPPFETGSPGSCVQEWRPGDLAHSRSLHSHVQWTRCSAYIVTMPRGHMTCVTPLL